MNSNLSNIVIVILLLVSVNLALYIHTRRKKCANLQSTLDDCKTRFKTEQDKVSELEKQVSIQAHQLVSLDSLKSSKTAQEEKILQLSGINSELKGKVSRFDDVIQELAETKDQLTETLTALATTTADLKNEKESSAENIKLLRDAQDEMSNRFKNLAQEIVEDKGSKLNDLHHNQLNVILKPFREQLVSFQSRINQVHESTIKDQTRLREQIHSLNTSNQSLNQEAKNLTRALKGDNKMQGNWGEVVLERVLEQSGLRKGREYVLQPSYRTKNDNKLLRPDVVINLPEGRNVIIDSKVSLVAYEEAFSLNEDPKQQAVALNKHILSVRSHIDNLSTKDYAGISEIKSPDFVLLFLPIETAFTILCESNSDILDRAFSRRIIIVSPSTLFATLRTIENIWKFDQQNKNTLLIADQATRMFDKLRLFLEDFKKLGDQIRTTQATYNSAISRYSEGKGNLMSHTEKLIELGVVAKKQLPTVHHI